MAEIAPENGEAERKSSRHRSRSRSRDRSGGRKRHRSSRRSRHRSRSRSGSRRRRRSRSRSHSRHRHSRRRSRSRSRRHRSRSHRRRSPSPAAETPAAPVTLKKILTEEEEMYEKAARAQRTVMVYQLFPKVDERDLFVFFSNVGTVTDIQLIRDQRTKKSKGLAYVEFEEPDAVAKALSLTGQLLGGYPISITYTQAEKNDLYAKAKPTEYGMRLYIGSLHTNVTEDDLKPIFDAFGPIDFIEIHKDPMTGESQGYGFVQYKNIKDAKAAMSQLNGLDVAGRAIRVSMSDDKRDGPMSMTLDDPTVQLDDTDSGTALTASARAALMARLSNQGKAGGNAGSAARVVTAKASPCLRITNMFDPASEKDPDWHLDIKEDVEEECQKHGRLKHVFVDRNSLGHVYVRFGDSGPAQKVVNTFNGRFFAGRQIHAAFFPEDQYNAKFPDTA